MTAGRPRVDAHLIGTNAVLMSAGLWLLPSVVFAALSDRGGWRRLPQRFGFVPRLPAPVGPRVWLHSVSAGEVAGAAPVVRALLDEDPAIELVVSCNNEAGLQMAARVFPQSRACFYLPFDLLPAVRMAVERLQPTACLLVEEELWPNFLWTLARGRMPVAVINGQISDQAFRRARRLRWFYRWMLRHVDLLCVQSPEEARRYRALGAPADRVRAVGSTKFDGVRAPDAAARDALTAALGWTAATRVWVAGSTHPGEEAAVLAAFRALRRRHADARLLLAPRHPGRAGEVVTQAARTKLRVGRRSNLRADADIVVLDTMGELSAAYGAGVAGFVGGSLVPVGGHNLLEPLAWGRPVLFGPYMHNFREIAEAVLAAGLGRLVRSIHDLAQAVSEVFDDPAGAARVADQAPGFLARHSGATQRTVAAVLPLVAAAERWAGGRPRAEAV